MDIPRGREGRSRTRGIQRCLSCIYQLFDPRGFQSSSWVASRVADGHNQDNSCLLPFQRWVHLDKGRDGSALSTVSLADGQEGKDDAELTPSSLAISSSTICEHPDPKNLYSADVLYFCWSLSSVYLFLKCLPLCGHTLKMKYPVCLPFDLWQCKKWWKRKMASRNCSTAEGRGYGVNLQLIPDWAGLTKTNV